MYYLRLISPGRQDTVAFFPISFLFEAQVRGTLDITSIGIFWCIRLRVLGIGFWYLPVRWQVGDRFFWWSGRTTRTSTTAFFLYLQFWALNRIFLVRGGFFTGGYLRGWSTTRCDVRLISAAMPDGMDRLQGSGVRSSVQDHGRAAGGAPTGDRRHASTGSSQNDLALAGASKLICFLGGWSKFI